MHDFKKKTSLYKMTSSQPTCTYVFETWINLKVITSIHFFSPQTSQYMTHYDAILHCAKMILLQRCVLKYCMSLTAEPTTVKRSPHTLQVPVVYAAELDSLYKFLHFPEEVALRLTATEHHLFYQVPPIDYLRQVTHDLAAPPAFGNAQETPAANVSAAQSVAFTHARPTVKDLIKRFNEVNIQHWNLNSEWKDKFAFCRNL
jgi:hypothetical protein